MAPGTLQNYYRDEINDDVNKNNVANNRITIQQQQLDIFNRR